MLARGAQSHALCMGYGPPPRQRRTRRVTHAAPRQRQGNAQARFQSTPHPRTVPFCVTRCCRRTHSLYCRLQRPRSRARLEGTARLWPHGIAAMRACSGAAPRRRRRRPYCRRRASLRRFSAAGCARLRRLGLRGRQLLQLRCPELAGGEQGLDAIVGTMLRQLSAALTSPLASPLTRAALTRAACGRRACAWSARSAAGPAPAHAPAHAPGHAPRRRRRGEGERGRRAPSPPCGSKG